MVNYSLAPWMLHVVDYFKTFCSDYNIEYDDSLYKFSFEYDGHVQRFFMSGLTRTANPSNFHDSLDYVQTMSSEFTFRMSMKKEASYDPDKIKLLNDRVEKLMACHCLLLSGVNEHEKIFSRRRILNNLTNIVKLSRPEIDYSFLSLLDLTSEEDCLAGLLFLYNILDQYDLPTISKVYSLEELISRSKIVAHHIAGNGIKNFELQNFSIENIFLGILPEPDYFFYFKKYSLNEWKEYEKLVRFLCSDNELITYEKYDVPAFSLFEIDKNIFYALQKPNFTKILSKKVIVSAINPLTKTELLNNIVPIIKMIPNQANATTVLDIIENVEKEKAKLYQYPFIFAHVMRDLSTCLNFIENAMIENQVVNFKDFHDATKTVLEIMSETKKLEKYTFEHILSIISNMLIKYMEKNPLDVQTFNDCLNITISPKIWDMPLYARTQMINKMRENYEDEKIIKLFSEAITYHAKNKKAKLLNKTKWNQIASEKETYKDLPYEWIYNAIL